MSRDSEFNSRTKRRHNKKRKMDKILNLLIGIVVLLIAVNIYFIFIKDDDKDVAEDESTLEEREDAIEEVSTVIDEEDDIEDENEYISNDRESTEESSHNIVQNNDSTVEKEEAQPSDSVVENNAPNESSNDIIVSTSNDDVVEQVIVNNDWKVTPTQQTGPHTSSFTEGHVDYEEKKLTIRNAVGLPEDNIIYWSIRNDGTGKGAISVVSSKDKAEKYRVHIKWIENAGWIPVKAEILKQLEGTYEVMN